MSYRRWFSIIAAILLLTSALLLAALLNAMHVVRQPGYPAAYGDPSIALQDNAFLWHDRACDILIYGDSTANVGLDPLLIRARTGHTACNIAETRPIVDDLGTLPLDTFLAHNPAPRLLVFQFGPELFYRSKSPWEHNGPFAPLVMLSRDQPSGTALRTMLRHPAETTQFALFILQNQLAPHKTGLTREQYNDTLAYAQASNGQLHLLDPAITSCGDAHPRPLYGPVDAAWLASLRQRYEARGIAVLIRAAPIPSCDPQYAQYQREVAPATDGPLDTLPINDFIAGYRHTTLAGSEADTLGLIALIRARHPELFR